MCIALLGYSIPVIKYFPIIFIIFLYVVHFFIDKSNFRKKLFMNKFMFFWAVYIGILGIGSENHQLFFERFPTLLISTVGMFVFSFYITDAEQIPIILSPMTFTLLFNLVLGFVQVIFNKYIFSNSLNIFIGTRFPIGPYNNPNDLATALVFMIIIQIYLIFLKKIK